MKLFVNCRAYAYDPVSRTYGLAPAFAVANGRFVAPGDIGGLSVERVDLDGATVVPAFADCHVHLLETGMLLGERDLSGVRDGATFESRIAALPGDAFVFAGKYDDAAWTDGALADPAALDRHHGERYALVSRVDVHSCLVNRRTLDDLALDPGTPGVELDGEGRPTGRLFGDANYAAQNRFFESLPAGVRADAARRAADLALAHGAVHLHAQLLGLGTREAYAAEIEMLRALPGVKIYPKICERDAALAASLGLPYVGGDVFLDGSLGSGTAATHEAYCDRAGSGTLMRSDSEVERFFREAEALGVSAGVHAIGDRAIEQCLSAWERVLAGGEPTRCRHFVEHFEMASPEQIARAARLGLYLSVQPQFEATWGGENGMYAARLGSARARPMNALRSALDAGAVLCGGDDSPVCALSPLAGMAAACAHRVESERLRPLEALTMYAYDAARFGHAETRTGLLQPGYDADFTILDRDPFSGASFGATSVLETWSGGVRAWSAG